MIVIQRDFRRSSRKLLWVCGIAGITIGLIQRPVLSQQPLSNPIPSDNIYHENNSLPADADIFPRLGRIARLDGEQTNCRLSPWGRIVSHVSGNSFIEIDRRQIDRNGDSWFHSRDLGCLIHQSRINLL